VIILDLDGKPVTGPAKHGKMIKLADILKEIQDANNQSEYQVGDIISSRYGYIHHVGIVTDIKKSKVIINKLNGKFKYPTSDDDKKQLVYKASNELVPITRSRIDSVGLPPNPHYDYVVVDDKDTPMKDFTREQEAKYKALK
jgi:hypothetical protein